MKCSACVLNITVLVVFSHVAGACFSFMSSEVKNTVSNGIEEAADAVKNEGQVLVSDAVKKGDKFVEYVVSEGPVLLDDVEKKAQDVGQYVNRGGQVLLRDIDNFFREGSGQCVCLSYNCGCCAHLEEPTIDLNSTICVNASYLVQDYGISLTVTVNHYTIFNETVSVRNPPPVCLGVPYVKEWAEACVRLHDIDASKSRLHACIRVEARMKRLVIAKYELGCFDLGPHASFELDNTIQVQQPSIVIL